MLVCPLRIGCGSWLIKCSDVTLILLPKLVQIHTYVHSTVLLRPPVCNQVTSHMGEESSLIECLIVRCKQNGQDWYGLGAVYVAMEVIRTNSNTMGAW